jgi:hypothetical protein
MWICGYEANASATVVMDICGRWRQVLDERRVGIGSHGPCSSLRLGDDPVCSSKYYSFRRIAWFILTIFRWEDIIYSTEYSSVGLLSEIPLSVANMVCNHFYGWATQVERKIIETLNCPRRIQKSEVESLHNSHSLLSQNRRRKSQVMRYQNRSIKVFDQGVSFVLSSNPSRSPYLYRNRSLKKVHAMLSSKRECICRRCLELEKYVVCSRMCGRIVQRKQLNLPREKRKGARRGPCLSTTTPPPRKVSWMLMDGKRYWRSYRRACLRSPWSTWKASWFG